MSPRGHEMEVHRTQLCIWKILSLQYWARPCVRGVTRMWSLARGRGTGDSPAPGPQRAQLALTVLPLAPPRPPSLPCQVLIVVPFREAALRVVQLFISLLEGDSKKKIIVSNKKRFNGEYGSNPEERPPNLKRPEDYEAVFVGNIDDHFRIGNSSLSRLKPRGTWSVRHT